MRRKHFFLLILTMLIIWIGYRGYRISTTRSHSPADTVSYSNNDFNLNVTYSRPYKNGREIFGEAKDRSWLPKGKAWTNLFKLITGLPRTTGALVPNGKYWRLGANDATEISFNRKINFVGNEIEAGTYRMYAVPNHDSWQIILNSETGQFGYYEPDHQYDVLEVEVPVEIVSETIEQFTIAFDGDSKDIYMLIAWDNLQIQIPLHFNPS